MASQFEITTVEDLAHGGQCYLATTTNLCYCCLGIEINCLDIN